MTSVVLILLGTMTKASIYFLVAAGLTLVFGVGKIINFAGDGTTLKRVQW